MVQRGAFLNMLAATEIRFSQLNGFLCFGCILRLPRAYILIFLLSADHCFQVRSSDLNSDFVNSVKVDDQWRSILNGTDVRLNTSRDGRNLTTPNNTLPSDVSDGNGDYEDYSLSYDDPEVLYDFDNEEMILSLSQASPQGKRKPIREGFTADQQKQLLRLHNSYRGNVTPPAGDMNFLEWDDYLTRSAQDWANVCAYKHGFPKNFTGHVGQNLYWGFDPTGVKAMHMWFEERHDYHLENLTCTPEKMCGHYTLMVWSGHRYVGCGRKWCKKNRNHYMVCHYSPSGNVHGYSPYTVGKSCSQCSSDSGGLCTNNLCVVEDQCKRNQEDCDPQCLLECHNCGVLNSTSCKCTCPDGWESLDCSRWCTDKDKRCGNNPGWPTITSCSAHRVIANEYCRKMCRKCDGIEDLNSTGLCCSGLECDDGYVIDPNRNPCECKLLCPGPYCYEDRELEPDVIPEEIKSGSQGLVKNSCAVLFSLTVLLIFLLK